MNEVVTRLFELKERMDLDNFGDRFYETVDMAITMIISMDDILHSALCDCPKCYPDKTGKPKGKE